MPILSKQPSIFPEDLLELPTDGADPRLWWAIYTKARQEKALARYLVQHSVPFYLPLVSKDNYIRGRRVVSHIPLFAGYVFLLGSEDDRVAALKSNRISRVLPVDDQEQLLRDLRQVRQLIDTGAPLTAERRLVPGRRVRVRHGAMAGLEGVVLERRGKARLLVAVSFLQQGVSVAIDDFMLEPIG